LSGAAGDQTNFASGINKLMPAAVFFNGGGQWRMMAYPCCRYILVKGNERRGLGWWSKLLKSPVVTAAQDCASREWYN